MEVLERQTQRYPGLTNEIQSVWQRVTTWVQNHPYDAELHQIPVVIPVVVHNIYKNAANKLSEDQIRQQIAVTNQHLDLMAPDLDKVPAIYRQRAANMRIRLEFAVRKPDGSATNGIEDHRTTVNGFSYLNDNMMLSSQGGVDAWDTNEYLNIWVGNVIDACGAAYYPYDSIPDHLHGIMVDRGCWWSNTTDGAVTLTHELGHFLGLIHIWGDSACGDDEVADTPQQLDDSAGILSGIVATGCTPADPNGRMYQNFMDYTDSTKLFTQGQAQRAWGFMNMYTQRSGLLSSNALLPPGGYSRRYVVDFVQEYSDMPSWKAALAMVHGAVVGQCIPASTVNNLVSAGARTRGNRYGTLPADVANAIFGLGLDGEEVLACYSPSGFHDRIMNRGPVALLEIGATSVHGITLTGITTSGSSTFIEINDPMNIGPRQFGNLGIEQRGHRKIVPYASLARFMEQAAANGKKIILARPLQQLAR